MTPTANATWPTDKRELLDIFYLLEAIREVKTKLDTEQKKIS